MKIERRTISYLIVFSHKKNVQKTVVTDVSCDAELSLLIMSTFKGRFRRPLALTNKDGVRIVVKRLDRINNTVKSIMNTIVYNKSVRQVRLETEKAIKCFC